MVNFIKISSLIIILLFFPISFYFNIIPINCNENQKLIKDSIKSIYVSIYPEEDYSKWYAFIEIYLKENAAPHIDIDWGEVNRNGNIFYVNISMKFINETLEFPVINRVNVYGLGFLEKGNYTFKLYINNELYKTENFIIEKTEPTLYYIVTPWIEWNGEEWIARVALDANMVPKGIHWGDVIKTKDGFMINIIVEEWTGNISKYSYRYGEHNYSLGILEEGEYWFYVYVNGVIDTFVPFEVSRILTTFTEIWSTATTTYTFIGTYSLFNTTIVYTVIVTDTYEKGKDITTYITIKVKEKSATTAITTETLTTKTIETKIKEKFEIENFIPLSLFIIVIMITILLYYFLFKRREI
jgi:hypothetical protein